MYKEKAVLSFSSSGDMESCFFDGGDNEIPVESIDGVCRGKSLNYQDGY